jgi:hypothetical protein
MNRSVQVG